MAMAISHQNKGHEFVNILPSLGVISRVRVRASVIHNQVVWRSSSIVGLGNGFVMTSQNLLGLHLNLIGPGFVS